MALQTSGTISIQNILDEMGYSKRLITINELAQLWYYSTRKTKFNTTTHKLSDWYGESWNITYGYYGGYSGNTSSITFNSSIGEL